VTIGSDMRRHDRRRAGFEVMVGTPNGPRVAGDIQLDAADLSEGGAFLRSDLLFEEGETLMLDIPLPSGKNISAEGRVVRVDRTEAGKAGMGIAFTCLDETDRRILSANLKMLMASTAKARPGKKP